MEQVYNEALEQISYGNEFLYFGSTKHFFDEYADILEKYLERMKNRAFRAREILMQEEIENDTAGRTYLKKVKANNNPNHQIRVLPKNIKFYENDNCIYSNKLAIFSLKKEVFVILIESENIAESYRNLFEKLWQGAKAVNRK